MIETGHLFPPAPHATHASSSISQQNMKLMDLSSQSMPAQGVPGPSTWFSPSRQAFEQYTQEQDDRYPYIGRRSRVVKRSKLVPHFATDSVINDDGAFNGSCANTQLSSSPLHTMEGTCASYYPDITAYCCSGIRGKLTTIPWGIDGEAAALSSASSSDSDPSTSSPTATSSSSSTASPSSSSSTSSETTQEPLCETTDYADALACFKLTAETNCKTGQSGLFGLCNPIGEDTSTVTTSFSSQTSGGARSKGKSAQSWNKKKWIGMAVVAGLLVTTI